MHGTELDIASVRVVYLRPAAGVLRIEPTAIHRGRSLGVMRIDVSNASGTLCTTATVTARSPVGPAAARRP
jgi:acyl-coenzyme A thioesterase PaaI-like protein